MGLPKVIQPQPKKLNYIACRICSGKGRIVTKESNFADCKSCRGIGGVEYEVKGNWLYGETPRQVELAMGLLHLEKNGSILLTTFGRYKVEIKPRTR